MRRKKKKKKKKKADDKKSAEIWRRKKNLPLQVRQNLLLRPLSSFVSFPLLLLSLLVSVSFLFLFV